MAEPDYSLAAHPYIPPAQNPLETLQGIEKYRILQHQNQLTGLEAQQKQIDVDSLAKYKNTGNNDDLRGATPDLRTGAVAGERSEQDNKKDVMSRDAAYIQGEKDPQIKQYLWDKKRADYVKKGWVDKETADKYPTPNDGVLGNLVKGNMAVPDYRATTGQTAGAESAARAPYTGEQTDPSKTYQYPATRPGGPLENGSPAGNIFGGGAPPTGTGPAPPRSKNVTDTNATVLPPNATPASAPGAPAVPGTPSAQPGKNVVPVDKTNPYSAEAPVVPVGHDLPSGKGIVQPGIDPVRQEARAEGLKKFNEEIEPAAAAASHTRASLGTMAAELDKGVTTDRLGELKTSVGAGLYALTGDTDFVKKATGLTTANQEVFNKESTRMGLTFARQTEGAREAVQAIRIALGANPSLLNTEEGNRKIIGIMDQSAKYDQERARAAQAFMQKNDGHLTGFDTWWSQAHSPATFISKAIPYPVPPRKEDFQNGVTYEFPYSKDAKGNPIMHRGTYNAETGSLDPVQQSNTPAPSPAVASSR